MFWLWLFISWYVIGLIAATRNIMKDSDGEFKVEDLFTVMAGAFLGPLIVIGTAFIAFMGWYDKNKKTVIFRTRQGKIRLILYKDKEE